MFLCSSALSTTFNMTTCFRLTWVRAVTIRIEHKWETCPVGHLVVQEQEAGVDISACRNPRARGWKMGAHIFAQCFLVEAVTNHLPHLESLIIDLSGPYADCSPWTRSREASDYLTSKIGLRPQASGLRNICARTLHSDYPNTFHFWSCLDDTAVDFVKTATDGAIVLHVFITSLPGSHLSPAVFDNFSPTHHCTGAT